MRKHTHAYAGFTSCGCMVAAVVDDGQEGHCAGDVAEFIRDGLRVERVTIERARAELKRCTHGQMELK